MGGDFHQNFNITTMGQTKKKNKHKCTGNKPKNGGCFRKWNTSSNGPSPKKSEHFSFQNALQRAERKTQQVKCPINYTLKKVWEQGLGFRV